MLEGVGWTQEELGGGEEQGEWCKYSDNIWNYPQTKKQNLKMFLSREKNCCMIKLHFSLSRCLWYN